MLSENTLNAVRSSLARGMVNTPPKAPSDTKEQGAKPAQTKH